MFKMFQISPESIAETLSISTILCSFFLYFLKSPSMVLQFRHILYWIDIKFLFVILIDFLFEELSVDRRTSFSFPFFPVPLSICKSVPSIFQAFPLWMQYYRKISLFFLNFIKLFINILSSINVKYICEFRFV